MREIEIDEAAGSLAELVDTLSVGDVVHLTRGGNTIAKLTSVPARQKIKLGVLEGKFTVPDDFDAPLPEDVLALFYDSPLFPENPPDGTGRR